MQITTRLYGDAEVVRPQGRIDHASSAAFEAELAPRIAAAIARPGALVLDFADIDYISSVGLRVLMIAAKQMREHQTLLLVAALQSVVAEIFAISRFDRVLSVVPSLDDALKRCSAAAQASYAAGAGAAR